jgi:iron complex outermembrane receptor protein
MCASKRPQVFARPIPVSIRPATFVAVSTLALFATASASNAQQTTTELPALTVTTTKAKSKVTPKSKQANPVSAEPNAADVSDNSQSNDDSASTGISVPLTTTQINRQEIQSKVPQTSDTAELLRDAPGVSIFKAGGVSGLPVINGLNDDRVKVLLNGMVVSSACANHMNPPLSYADPSQIAYVEVVTGVTPVSKGGDSLGGTVIVETLPPHFTGAGEGVHTAGSVSAFYRSNGDGVGTAVTAHAANNTVSVNYAGAWTRSGNYEDGRGNEVLSSEFEAQNHSVQLAVRNGGDLFTLQGGFQNIPYQAYVNQYMDMVENKAWFLNARYVTSLDWGKLDARVFYQNTRHAMDFLEDKQPGTMPMLTEGQDVGYVVKAEIPLSERDLLRVGNEFHHQGLDDRWPPVPGSMMMEPDTYWNINGGTRQRLGTFVEWERQWAPAWSTLLGVRNDMVWMDTGDVQAYCAMGMMCEPDASAAAAFNALDRSRTDANFDVTALARYTPVSDRKLRVRLRAQDTVPEPL